MLWIKRFGPPVVIAALKPIRVIGLFIIRTAGIRIYRFFFILKTRTSAFCLPAKNRVLYLIANRYAVHAAVVSVVFVTSLINFNGNYVRGVYGH